MAKHPVRKEPREQSVVTQIRPGATEISVVKKIAMESKPQPKKNNAWIGLVFVAAAVGLGWFAWKSESGSQRSQRHDLNQIDNMVNKHLIMTNKMIELQQEKAKMEYNDPIPEVGESIMPRWKPQQVVGGVDHSPDRNEMNAARDLEAPKDLNLNSPDTIIQSEMADAEKKREYDNKYKEEYARRFIENARAGGYEIELDENFVVKKVRKISSDDGNGLFNSH